MSTVAFIALGSNLGDRRAMLAAAVEHLQHQPGAQVVRVSRYWETDPVGGPADQPRFLNAAAEVATDLDVRDFFSLLLHIEKQLGRERHELYGPRTIDLDLLLFGDQVIQEKDLVVPHPRMHQRAFVLGPLVEIAATVVHPVLKRTMAELLARVAAQPLCGQRAVVTGSSSGIGRAIALELARRGVDVIIHAHRSQEQAELTCQAAAEHGVRSSFLLTDLRETTACHGLVEEAWRRLGGIDIWVNNAGADVLTAGAFQRPFEDRLHDLMAVDVLATIRLSRAVGDRFKQAGHGVILNMGWDQAETGMEGDSGQLFGATKGAVMAFTKSLARTLAPQVRVNCLAPGWIRTAWGQSASTAWQERVLRDTPLARWGTPDDVAKVAAWLVSADAAFITGQIIRINGGAVQ
jgi:2-amino-4-hydroxy-6-hydroxymethyldihydropteridine diphosphokinase